MKALEEFETGYWGQRYPAIVLSWRRNWEHVMPFFAFPESVRRIIYTTNAIEALNSKLRRALRTRGHFPNDETGLTHEIPDSPNRLSTVSSIMSRTTLPLMPEPTTACHAMISRS